ncbi:hypothetical protein IFM89_011701 [Coptis chinensis]|uniref:Uncharacterized protein n=1 Tax=Coptis chinensis TaxID=261450 RepID=A0A835GX74_9MAGN|nr:hypothetical protein IFM89_011701 [Coptis chinensis]
MVLPLLSPTVFAPPIGRGTSTPQVVDAVIASNKFQVLQETEEGNIEVQEVEAGEIQEHIPAEESPLTAQEEAMKDKKMEEIPNTDERPSLAERNSCVQSGMQQEASEHLAIEMAENLLQADERAENLIQAAETDDSEIEARRHENAQLVTRMVETSSGHLEASLTSQEQGVVDPEAEQVLQKRRDRIFKLVQEYSPDCIALAEPKIWTRNLAYGFLNSQGCSVSIISNETADRKANIWILWKENFA